MTPAPVTVLGAGGFIGGHLVRHLQRLGIPCFAPLRGDPSVFRRPLGHVVYAIGLTADFRSRPLDTVEAHVCLLRRLLAQGDYDSLTYLSSSRVYAGADSGLETAVLRADPQQPGDLYNLSKLMGESMCLHAGRKPAKVARLSNIVGLRPDADIFIDQLLAEGSATGRVVLRTAMASRKDYLYVDDAVAALAQLALADTHGIYNLASGEAVPNSAIAQALRRHLGIEVVETANAPVWDFVPVATDKLRALLPFAPRRFDDYFPDYLALYRQTRMGAGTASTPAVAPAAGPLPEGPAWRT